MLGIIIIKIYEQEYVCIPLIMDLTAHCIPINTIEMFIKHWEIRISSHSRIKLQVVC